jgi:hypothetical protein
MPKGKVIARAFALSVGWLGAVLGLYVCLVGLELYWNFFDWLPRWDWKVALFFVAILMMLTAVWFLRRGTPDRFSRAVSLLLCLALIALALYVLPPERLSEGLFARTSPSPLWYRGGRLIVMWLPAVFWVRKKQPETKPPARH